MIIKLLRRLRLASKSDPISLSTCTVQPVPWSPLAGASNAFCFDLWSQLDRSRNLVFSPASIAMGLAMTAAGARGQTAARMCEILHLDSSIGEVATEWQAVLRTLTCPEQHVRIRIANRLFGDAAYAFEREFIEHTATLWGAPLDRLDFRGASESSRAAINSWVAAQTEHRIRDLLPPDVIRPDTRLALVNAIYFLADWASPFQKTATYDEPFFVTSRDSKAVPMMHRSGSYRVAHVDSARILEMPYVEHKVAMLLVLPDRLDGLPDIENSVSTKRLASWMAALSYDEVDISLPRFELNVPQAIELRDPLTRLGLGVAFDRAKADFTGIAFPSDPASRLCIQDVFHKAFVRVDEKGTEAAAATAVIMCEVGCAPKRKRPIPFVADHPFLFFVVDQATGLVLFAGRLADPSVY